MPPGRFAFRTQNERIVLIIDIETMKKFFWIIISIAATAAAAFPSFDAEKLDADSAGSLAATAETFTSFNQTAMASFPLSNAEADAMAAAFLPLLLLTRLKRYLAQHRARKHNHQIPAKTLARIFCSLRE